MAKIISLAINKQLTVNPPPEGTLPTADIHTDWAQNNPPRINTEIQFESNSSHGSNLISTNEWFVNGNVEQTYTELENTPDVNDHPHFLHTFTNTETNTITLGVNDTQGRTSTKTISESFTDTPTPDFQWEPQAPAPEQEILFYSTSTTYPGNPITNHQWHYKKIQPFPPTNWGPLGNTPEEETTTAKFPTHQTIEVILEITATSGERINSTTKTITIEPCNIGETKECSTGLQGICAEGTQTCIAPGIWGECIQEREEEEFENCGSGEDDNCNGLVDCADPYCNTWTWPATPQSCEGSPQTSQYCFAGQGNEGDENYIPPSPNYPECIDTSDPLFPVHYYCGLGTHPTNPLINHTFCCEAGEVQSYDPLSMEWYCGVTEPCHPSPPYECAFDYYNQFSDWIGNNDCVNPNEGNACCPTIAYGEYGYYADLPENVKIY